MSVICKQEGIIHSPLTEAGANRITIGDQTYGFIRSFMHIADCGAVVFTPA